MKVMHTHASADRIESHRRAGCSGRAQPPLLRRRALESMAEVSIDRRRLACSRRRMQTVCDVGSAETNAVGEPTVQNASYSLQETTVREAWHGRIFSCQLLDPAWCVHQALVETAMLAAVSGLAYLVSTVLKLENTVRTNAKMRLFPTSPYPATSHPRRFRLDTSCRCRSCLPACDQAPELDGRR